MSLRKTIAVLSVLVLAGSGSVRADPTPGVWAGRAEPAALRPAAAATERPSGGVDVVFSLIREEGREYRQRIPAGGRPGAVQSLPGAPDSASLFLYAVGTLGALQVSRSARRLQLGEVSAWLHTCGIGPAGQTDPSNPFEVYQTPLPAMLVSAASLSYASWPTVSADPPGRSGDLLVRIQRSSRGPPGVCWCS